MLLTHLIPSLSAMNVWDCPLWAWRQYGVFLDEYQRQQREARA